MDIKKKPDDAYTDACNLLSILLQKYPNDYQFLQGRRPKPIDQTAPVIGILDLISHDGIENHRDLIQPLQRYSIKIDCVRDLLEKDNYEMSDYIKEPYDHTGNPSLSEIAVRKKLFYKKPSYSRIILDDDVAHLSKSDKQNLQEGVDEHNESIRYRRGGALKVSEIIDLLSEELPVKQKDTKITKEKKNEIEYKPRRFIGRLMKKIAEDFAKNNNRAIINRPEMLKLLHKEGATIKKDETEYFNITDKTLKEVKQVSQSSFENYLKKVQDHIKGKYPT